VELSFQVSLGAVDLNTKMRKLLIRGNLTRSLSNDKLASPTNIPPSLKKPCQSLETVLCCSSSISILTMFMALCYKQGGRGFNLSIALNLPATLGPGVASASNRNEYQESSWE
jgi:hypothetical protein